MNKWMRSMSIAGFVTGWMTRASRDGKITPSEISELVTHLAEMLDIEVEIPVPPSALGEFPDTYPYYHPTGAPARPFGGPYVNDNT